MCPPNQKRMAESIFSPNVCSCRERNRAPDLSDIGDFQHEAVTLGEAGAGAHERRNRRHRLSYVTTYYLRSIVCELTHVWHRRALHPNARSMFATAPKEFRTPAKLVAKSAGDETHMIEDNSESWRESERLALRAD